MGFSEQDAQELLISLLSSMKKLEAERQKKVLPEALGIEDRRHPTAAEQQLAQRFKIAANHTVVDAIFGGQLLCCIRCTECNHRSFTFEAFMDLSLSLNTAAKNDNNTGVGGGKFTTALKKYASQANTSVVSTGAGGGGGNGNSRNKGYKNKKNKSSHSKVDVTNDQDGGEDEENMPPLMMDIESTAEEEDAGSRTMTPRERKDKRAAKKAAKRQARQVARDQAAQEQQQDHSAGLEVRLQGTTSNDNDNDDDGDDGFKSGSDEEEIEEEEEEDDQDSTGAVDGGMSSPELLDGGCLAAAAAATSTSTAGAPTAAYSGDPLDENSYWCSSSSQRAEVHGGSGGGGDDLHQIPMDIVTGDLDDYDDYQQLLARDADSVALAADPTLDYDRLVGVSDDHAMDIGGVGGNGGPFYGTDDGIDWSADPASFVAEQQFLDSDLVNELLGHQQLGQQQQQQQGGPAGQRALDLDHLAIETLLAADIPLPSSSSSSKDRDGNGQQQQFNIINGGEEEDDVVAVYGPQLPAQHGYYYDDGDQAMSTGGGSGSGGTADSGIGSGAGSMTTTASSTNSTMITAKGPDSDPHHLQQQQPSPEVDVFASGDSMDAPTTTTTTTSNSNSNSPSSSPNGKSGSSKVHSNNTPTLLPHVDPAFRSKLYELALQKVSYGGEASGNNGDLGRLFEAFIKPETLDGVNKYLCDGCTAAAAAAKKKKMAGNENSGDNKKAEKVYTKAVRTQLIALPPAVLVVHLKRFEANAFGGSRSGGGGFTRGAAYAHKLSTAISFPERLCLAPYTSRLYEMAYAQFYESSKEEDEEEGDEGGKLEYQLYGVVLHSGSLRSGHYTAYVAVRPAAYFDPGHLSRFLHLKPFVPNIEHIVGVCYEKEVGQKKEEETKMDVKKEEEDEGMKENGDGHYHLSGHSTLVKTAEEVGDKPNQEKVKNEDQQQQAMMMATDDDLHHHYHQNYSAVNGDHNYLGDGHPSAAVETLPSQPPPPLPPHRRTEAPAVVGDQQQQQQRKWYHISDTSVQATNLASVLRETTSPYMLFYERIQ